ncbi:MAG TPA: hypothetical protein VJS64_19035 [Pyrinomonadaceae bacterium]|nr:hypothetical protein [Pyrinomonadaceae bacterium]
MTKSLRILIILTVLTGACHDPACMEHSHCDDNVILQVKSPDGAYLATVYHRSCAGGSGRYTCAMVEEVPAHWWSSKGDVGHLLNIPEFHPITAVWKDRRHLEITTTALPSSYDQLPTNVPHESWHDVDVWYRR